MFAITPLEGERCAFAIACGTGCLEPRLSALLRVGLLTGAKGQQSVRVQCKRTCTGWFAFARFQRNAQELAPAAEIARGQPQPPDVCGQLGCRPVFAVR